MAEVSYNDSANVVKTNAIGLKAFGGCDAVGLFF
jgi:hypothetical protein